MSILLVLVWCTYMGVLEVHHEVTTKMYLDYFNYCRKDVWKYASWRCRLHLCPEIYAHWPKCLIILKLTLSVVWKVKLKNMWYNRTNGESKAQYGNVDPYVTVVTGLDSHYELFDWKIWPIHDVCGTSVTRPVGDQVIRQISLNLNIPRHCWSLCNHCKKWSLENRTNI